MSYLTPDPSQSILTLHSVDYRNDGNVFLTLSIPETLFPAVKSFLDFSGKFFSHVQLKTKHQKALVMSVDPYEIERRKKAHEKYTHDILARYDLFRSSGLSSRAAIRETKEFFNSRGRAELTCGTIELIVRASGRLRKSWGKV